MPWRRVHSAALVLVLGTLWGALPLAEAWRGGASSTCGQTCSCCARRSAPARDACPGAPRRDARLSCPEAPHAALVMLPFLHPVPTTVPRLVVAQAGPTPAAEALRSGFGRIFSPPPEPPQS